MTSLMSSQRLSEEDDVRRRKKEAAEFYRVTGVPQLIEGALNELFVQRPADLHGYLAEYFVRLSAPPTISRLRGRELYDARGQLSIEAQVFCTVCNKEQSMSSAAVSTYFPPEDTGLDWLAEGQQRAAHLKTAVQWINGPLSSMLTDQNPRDQPEVDRRLSSFFSARFQEEKEAQKQENNESPSPSQEEDVFPSPASVRIRGKKSAGKKSTTAEKPFPPAEPPEPVLHGSTAIGSVSLAVAKTGARVQGIPLYKHIAALKNQKVASGATLNDFSSFIQFHIPIPLVTLLSCGKSSPGKLCLLEEVVLVPKTGQQVKQIVTMSLRLQKEMMRMMNSSAKTGATYTFMSDSGAPAVSFERPEQPLDLITDACRNLEVKLGTEVYLALSCAAPKLMDYSKGKYEVAAGVLKTPDELVDTYQTLLSKYPALVALIDPFRREDTEQWEKLSNMTGNSCSLLCDITRRPQAPPLPGVRGYILKHVNETTVSEMIRVASDCGGSVLMGTADGEACSDDSLSDLAVGLGLEYVKLGGLSGAERMTKYNRLISIEEELAQQGILVYKEKHAPPLFPGTAQELPSAAE